MDIHIRLIMANIFYLIHIDPENYL